MSDDPIPVTLVLFRKWRGTKDVFALFPELPSDYQGFFCDSFERIGQHSGADYHLCINASDPASAEDAAELRQELERIGYRLKPIQRASYKHHEARRATARSYRA